MLRPIVRPIVRPLVRGVTEPGYGSLAAQILALFRNGEQGAWYDPSDLSTLYQDSAGTTPVTALAQPVGLMLDKSKGLVRGPELVTNGGFDSDTWWAKGTGWSIAGGVAVANASAAWIGVTKAGVVITGKVYEICFELVSRSSGSVVANLGNNTGPAISVPGTYSSILTCGAATFCGVTASGSGFTGTIDNISVRELPGNRASQPTATARPVLAAGNKIDFDGVDDKLTTTFPDLGSDVTIVRSVPGTGASILTGQTIGAGVWDDSTDHHGLLIINRALTAPETALVTRWANMRAGV